ncbi:MAG: aminotransferase class I/II-fold pyridoxal phosphate-dependent enzyme, partial [SAR324 cluster bacterium]|nr:aminotransferase class I/II-fold pyridoxal phosphate-dependent enzyme [SAR324 cluster bacterium]
MNLFADRIAELGTENAFKMGPHIVRVENDGHQVIRLNLGEPDFNIPEYVKTEIKHQLDSNNTHYCDPKGLVSLRKAISKQMKEMRGLDISPERIVIFPGGKPAIGFCQEVYCNRGDEVIYP